MCPASCSLDQLANCEVSDLSAESQAPLPCPMLGLNGACHARKGEAKCGGNIAEEGTGKGRLPMLHTHPVPCDNADMIPGLPDVPLSSPRVPSDAHTSPATCSLSHMRSFSDSSSPSSPLACQHPSCFAFVQLVLGLWSVWQLISQQQGSRLGPGEVCSRSTHSCGSGSAIPLASR